MTGSPRYYIKQTTTCARVFSLQRPARALCGYHQFLSIYFPSRCLIQPRQSYPDEFLSFRLWRDGYGDGEGEISGGDAHSICDEGFPCRLYRQPRLSPRYSATPMRPFPFSFVFPLHSPPVIVAQSSLTVRSVPLNTWSYDRTRETDGYLDTLSAPLRAGFSLREKLDNRFVV